MKADKNVGLYDFTKSKCVCCGGKDFYKIYNACDFHACDFPNVEGSNIIEAFIQFCKKCGMANLLLQKTIVNLDFKN